MFNVSDAVVLIHDVVLQAIALVAESGEYRQSELGGQGGVFTVDDARGELSTTLVFKRYAQLQLAQLEASHIDLLNSAIVAGGLQHRFGVPRSMGIVEDGNFSYHVTERQRGRSVASLPRKESAKLLESCIEALALYHRVCIPPPGGSGWRAVKIQLLLWARTLLGVGQERLDLVAHMKACLSIDSLPVVRKRDAHPGNWLLDSAGRIISVDLTGSYGVPVGFDVAQLIEDTAILPATADGFAERYRLFAKYLDLTNLGAGVRVAHVYDWFALTRSLRIATVVGGSKALHGHARSLASHIAANSTDEPMRVLAAEVLRLVSNAQSRVDGGTPTGSAA